MTDEYALTDPTELGLLDSPPDDRDWPLQGAIADNPVPTDRRFSSGAWPHAGPPDNQLLRDATHSACVAFSGCKTRVVTEQLVNGRSRHYDQLELYRRCKEIDGVPDHPGTYIRVAAQILRDRGARLNNVDGTAVSPDAYERISGYVRVETLLSEIKKAIYYLGHCWVAVRWYRNWNPSANPPAVMPKPGTYATGHGIVFVEWDDDLPTWAGKGALRFENSFAKGWAVAGDGWLPYQVLPTVLREAWATFAMPDEPTEPTQPTEPTEPASGDPTEDDMPAISSYLPGYTATIGKAEPARVREAPTLAGKVIRTTSTPEAWTIVGLVNGDKPQGETSDQWVARHAGGRWEYTHSSNVPTAPQAPADATAIQAELDDIKTLAIKRGDALVDIKKIAEEAA